MSDDDEQNNSPLLDVKVTNLLDHMTLFNTLDESVVKVPYLAR